MASLSSRERWDKKYAAGAGATVASPFLQDVAHLIPTSGTALDVAGGAGRNALWLANHGLDATLLDVSNVGLQHAREAAIDAQIDLTLMAHDLETDGFPDGQWDVILIHLFLDWNVMNQVVQHVSPSGLFVFMQPTATNLERNPSPSRRFLLEPGQLATWVADQELDVLHHAEDWVPKTGRHESRLVAQLRQT